MTESKCCFGSTNSRNCAWVISIFNMFVCIILVLPILHNLTFINYTQPPQDLISNNFLVFNLLCMLFLLFYINLSLNKATYTRNVQSIHHWLVTVWIFFIFFFLFICFAAFVNRFPRLITIGIPVTIVVAYQIHVVKTYHDDELEFVAAAIDGRNVIVGPPLQNVVASSAAAAVALAGQNVAALFPVRAGGPPYTIHQQQPQQLPCAYASDVPQAYQYRFQHQQQHQQNQQQQQQNQQQHQHQQQQHHQQQQQQSAPGSNVQPDRHDSQPPPPPYSPVTMNYFNSGPSEKH